MTSESGAVRPVPMPVSLSKRLAPLLILALGIVAAVGVLMVRSRNALVESARRVADTHEILQALDALQSDMVDAETGQRGYVITGEKSYLEPFDDAVERVAGDIRRLAELVGEGEVRERLADLEPLVEQKISISNRIIELRRTSGLEAAASLVRTDQGKAAMDRIRRLLSRMRDRERELLVERTTLAEAEARFAKWVFVGGSAVSALLVGMIFLLVGGEARARRRTEQALRRSSAISEGVLASMADAVVVADGDGRVISMNPSADRLFASTSRDASGAILHPPTVFHDDGRTPFSEDEAPLARAIRGEPIDGVECLTVSAAGGEPIWLSVSGRPLATAEGMRIGGVCVFRDVTGTKRDELALQESNANLVASVEELERRNEEISLLGELSGLLQACLDEAEASGIIAQSLERLLPRSRGALYLMNASRTLAFAGAMWGQPPPSVETFAPDGCWALRRGRAHALDARHLGLRCTHLGNEVESYVCIPLMAQGDALGVLHVRVEGTSSTTTGEQVQRLLHALADEIGLALANLRMRESLRQQSIRDPLTNLFNRRYMEESLDRELQRAARREAPLAVLMIDIDHFKSFNDSFGHDGGDALLCELGTVLRSGIRGEDLACRYGGEEFVVILPETDLETAVRRAEGLRATVKGVVVNHQGHTMRAITLSIGVAVYPDHGRDGKTLVHEADQALYRAKCGGRDRVLIASDERAPAVETAA